MKRTRHVLWLERPHGDAIVGSSIQLGVAHLDDPVKMRQIRDFLQGQTDPLTIDESLRDMLLQCNVLVGDEDFDPDSPLDLVTEAGYCHQATLQATTSMAAQTSVLLEAASSLGKALIEDGILSVTLWTANAARDVGHLDKLVRALRQWQHKNGNRLFLDIRVHSRTLPPSLADWAEKTQVALEIAVDLPDGLPGMPMEEFENIRRASKRHIPVLVQTRISPGNVKHMVSIAQHHAELTGGLGGLDLPLADALPEKSAAADQGGLDAVEEYADHLLDIYRMQLVSDDMFPAIGDLRQRLARGCAAPQCGCAGKHTTCLDKDGQKYPCEGTRRLSKQLGKHTAADKLQVPLACKNCQWQFFCGMPCLATLGAHERAGSHEAAQYAHAAFCLPRQRLLQAMIWDIVDDRIAQLQVGQVS